MKLRMLSISKIRLTALRTANVARAVILPEITHFCQGWNQNRDFRHQKRLWDNPPGIYDPSASPLLLVSSKWNDTQMIAAGQINPVRAGSWEDEMHSRFKAPPSSPQVISCHIRCQGKEIEQIVAGSYARPTQLIDVAHPDVLHPGAAGVTEVHLQASRLLCRSDLQFTTERHEVARANSCEPTEVETCFQRCFTTGQSEEIAYAPVKGNLLTACPAYTNACSLTGKSIPKEMAAYRYSKWIARRWPWHKY